MIKQDQLEKILHKFDRSSDGSYVLTEQQYWMLLTMSLNAPEALLTMTDDEADDFRKRGFTIKDKLFILKP